MEEVKECPEGMKLFGYVSAPLGKLVDGDLIEHAGKLYPNAKAYTVAEDGHVQFVKVWG